MAGLVVGVIRMVMDFSYKAPLCMEIDQRPAFVAKVIVYKKPLCFLQKPISPFQFHYMYFAAFLFWTTGIVAFIVSLCTKPDEKYRVLILFLNIIG